MASNRKSKFLAGRFREIVTHRNAVLSASGGLLAGLLLIFSHIPNNDPGIAVKDLVGPLLSFTGFAFAVATTAVSVVLALPFGRASALMMVNSPDADSVQIAETPDGAVIYADSVTSDMIEKLRRRATRSYYLDLVFVFAWTAVVSVAASLVCLSWMVAFGNESVLASSTPMSDIATAVVLSFTIYTAMQMVASISAAYRVAVIISTAYRTKIADDSVRTRNARAVEERERRSWFGR